MRSRCYLLLAVFLGIVPGLDAHSPFRYDRGPFLVAGAHYAGRAGFEVGVNRVFLFGVKRNKCKNCPLSYSGKMVLSFSAEVYPGDLAVVPKISMWRYRQKVKFLTAGISMAYAVSTSTVQPILRPEIGFRLEKPQKAEKKSRFPPPLSELCRIKLVAGYNHSFNAPHAILAPFQVSLVIYQERPRRSAMLGY